jgi:hypothetical protein
VPGRQELEETQARKDLIRIDEQRNELRGLAKAILVSLRSHYGAVPAALQQQIHSLTTEDRYRHGTGVVRICRSITNPLAPIPRSARTVRDGHDLDFRR